jgi:hypothetical protein
MAILRFVWMLISWLAVEVFVFLPLFIVGAITFPVFYHYAPLHLVESRINEGQFVLAFQWAWLDEWLGNHEDGLLPNWWSKEQNGTPYGWFIRNPVSNMRFWPYISTLPDPTKVQWIGSLDHIPSDNTKGWFLCWQGPYTGFYWQGASLGVWLGWATSPRDSRPDAPRDYRWFGLGTKAQIWRVK